MSSKASTQHSALSTQPVNDIAAYLDGNQQRPGMAKCQVLSAKCCRCWLSAVLLNCILPSLLAS